jgi:hypothetical protein
MSSHNKPTFLHGRANTRMPGYSSVPLSTGMAAQQFEINYLAQLRPGICKKAATTAAGLVSSVRTKVTSCWCVCVFVWMDVAIVS